MRLIFMIFSLSLFSQIVHQLWKGKYPRQKHFEGSEIIINIT